MLWDQTIAFWDRLGFWMMVIGGAFSVLGLGLALGSSFILNRVGNATQAENVRQSNQATLEIAKLNQHTAQLQQHTAELERQNLELEKQVAPRRLEQDRSATALRAFAGTPVLIVPYPESEPRRLAAKMLVMFQSAGWSVRLMPPREADMADGVEVEYVAAELGDETKVAEGERRTQAAATILEQLQAS